MSIHPTAIVSDSAVLADDVELGAYCVIGNEVVVEAGCRISSHVVINGPTRIGRSNRIYQFCSLGDDPQDKKYAGEPTRLEIGNNNTIREFCTISRGTVQDQGLTTIGNDNWIMAYVHIAHDCRIGNQCIFANNATLAGHVHVGDWAIFGGFTGAHQFCRIGAHSFLGMYAGTSRDVPAYTMISGQPPSPKGINSEGLKRRGFSAEQVRNIRNAYRVVYRSGLKLTEAIAELEGQIADNPELELFVKSLKSSERGIIR
ncbi:MAG: acyl-ACP--UDP-N-acetylglucosamine O-acyltransferase [Pseudomonadota bacterium]|nr:acyl-ACP--UDP-N-acetylglucosamine O-acyltransferase [Pseudomonadota bacterium]